MKMTTLFLLATAVATALIAGLFYAYSCSVNPGLGALSDKEYLTAMQSINKAIQNPLFALSFMGTLLLLPISTYLNYQPGFSGSSGWLLAATGLYTIGVFGITVFGNVPLNEALAQLNLPSLSVEELSQQRVKFEIPWNQLHFLRTIASIVSLIFVLIGMSKKF